MIENFENIETLETLENPIDIESQMTKLQEGLNKAIQENKPSMENYYRSEIEKLTNAEEAVSKAPGSEISFGSSELSDLSKRHRELTNEKNRYDGYIKKANEQMANGASVNERQLARNEIMSEHLEKEINSTINKMKNL